MESAGVLRHFAFFEALAGLTEKDDTWRELSGGLLVARLLDSWLTEGPKVCQPGSWSVSAVRDAIDEISPGRPARAILNSVVDAMAAASTSCMRSVTPRLIAYGRCLEYDGRWLLAADIYQTVIEHTHPVHDSESAVAAHLRLGISLRTVGDTEGATQAYRTAAEVASAAGDMLGVLKARIGEAKIAIVKGNLPQAEKMLDQTILDASRPGLESAKSMALHDRSHTAALRGEYSLAVKLAYQAFSCSQAPQERDRILHDIATTLYKLGVASAARDAYLILASTAQEQYSRWAATIQLMAMAADDRVGPIFERYKRDLAASALPPVLRADFEYVAGHGYYLFGDRVSAAQWLHRSIETAREHSLNQMLFLAEEELARLEFEAEPISGRGGNDPHLEIDEITSAIRNMRETAGV